MSLVYKYVELIKLELYYEAKDDVKHTNTFIPTDEPRRSNIFDILYSCFLE